MSVRSLNNKTFMYNEDRKKLDTLVMSGRLGTDFCLEFLMIVV